MAISVVLVAGSLAVSPIAIAGDDEDDEEGDDDACSPDFICIPSDDDESCPAGFTCEEECDDGDCELKECEVNGDDDGICAKEEGNLIIFFHDAAGNGIEGAQCSGHDHDTVILFGPATTDIDGIARITMPPGLTSLNLFCSIEPRGIPDRGNVCRVPVTEPITEADILRPSFLECRPGGF